MRGPRHRFAEIAQSERNSREKKTKTKKEGNKLQTRAMERKDLRALRGAPIEPAKKLERRASLSWPLARNSTIPQVAKGK